MPANWWIGSNVKRGRGKESFALALRDPKTGQLLIYDPDEFMPEIMKDLD
jgi:hypothetical protein